MYFEESVVKKAIDKILMDPKNLATPLEMEQQAKAAVTALEKSDVNRDYIVDHSEIRKLCELLGLPIDDEDDSLLQLDTDQSGQLESEEFLVWWLTRVSQQPNSSKQQEIMAKNVFKRYDIDNSNTISALEFENLVKDLGADFTPEECDEAIRELDTDKNGTLECNEFVQWWVDRTKSVRRGGGLIAFKLKKLANTAAKIFNSDIHTAVWNNDIDLVKMFLEGDKRCKDSSDTTEYGNGWTPLQYASYKGYFDIVKLLIENEVQIDRRNNDGFTALFYACQQEHCNIIEILLENGADCTICGKDLTQDNPQLMCPFDMVVSLGNTEIRSLFEYNEKCVLPNRLTIYEILNMKDININNNIVMINIKINDNFNDLSELPIKKWGLCIQNKNSLNNPDNNIDDNDEETKDNNELKEYVYVIHDDNINTSKCISFAMDKNIVNKIKRTILSSNSLKYEAKVSICVYNALGHSKYSEPSNIIFT
jgi:Ca2+-binding EF-hand superfamily protein